MHVSCCHSAYHRVRIWPHWLRVQAICMMMHRMRTVDVSWEFAANMVGIRVRVISTMLLISMTHGLIQSNADTED